MATVGRTPEAGLLAPNVEDDDVGRTADVHLNPDVDVGAEKSRTPQTDAEHCQTFPLLAVSAAVFTRTTRCNIH